MPQEDQITGLQISGGIMCEKCTLETDNRCSIGGANCATPLHPRVQLFTVQQIVGVHSIDGCIPIILLPKRLIGKVVKVTIEEQL